MGYTTIAVKEEVYRKLLKIKEETGIKSWNEVVDAIINMYNMCLEEERRSRVRKVMCNDLNEARASLMGWVKKLQGVFGEEKDVLLALEYLMRDPDDPDMLVVNKDKCCMKG